MRTLAVKGGYPIVQTPIKPLLTISAEEAEMVATFMTTVARGQATLSGYLAGSIRGGGAVQMLEARWATEFKVKHAIACNSCTSAILAALEAMTHGDPVRTVVVPTMGMSAAASAGAVLGLRIRFADVDDHFCIVKEQEDSDITLAVSLFGQPIDYTNIKPQLLIEDNAQAPWASWNGEPTGLGRLHCWSFNVHKIINGGEGGMVTTNDDTMADHIRGFINHGEMRGKGAGLNLRMPELTAVLVMGQMRRAKNMVAQRTLVASMLNEHIGTDTAFTLPKVRPGTSSAWYCYPLLIDAYKRDWAVSALNAEGVPCRGGYVLMHRLPAFAGCARGSLKNAERLDSQLVLIELTSLNPTTVQIDQMAEAIREIGRK